MIHKNIERDNQIKELRASGLSYGEIGKLFNLTHQRIQQITSGFEKIAYELAKKNSYHATVHFLTLERDNHQCQACGAKERLVIHHIDGIDTHDWERNLMTLCRPCHMKLHLEVDRV